jgi:hypothetical protein
MAELKTKPENQSVEEFLQQIEPEQKRNDSYWLSKDLNEGWHTLSF